MTKLREAAQQALEALEGVVSAHAYASGTPVEAITAIKAALAEPVREPVAWIFEARHIDTAFGPAVSIRHPGREHKYMRNVKPLYTTPPQRQPLTEEEIIKIFADVLQYGTFFDAARAIERAHGIGGQP